MNTMICRLLIRSWFRPTGSFTSILIQSLTVLPAAVCDRFRRQGWGAVETTNARNFNSGVLLDNTKLKVIDNFTADLLCQGTGTNFKR